MIFRTDKRLSTSTSSRFLLRKIYARPIWRVVHHLVGLPRDEDSGTLTRPPDRDPLQLLGVHLASLGPGHAPLVRLCQRPRVRDGHAVGQCRGGEIRYRSEQNISYRISLRNLVGRAIVVVGLAAEPRGFGVSEGGRAGPCEMCRINGPPFQIVFDSAYGFRDALLRRCSGGLTGFGGFGPTSSCSSELRGPGSELHQKSALLLPPRNDPSNSSSPLPTLQ